MFENIPQEMRAYNQFVCWRYEENEGGNPTKVPYSPLNGQPMSVNDPATWGTYEQAISALGSGWYNGIGFVLTENDPYAFIDLDEPKLPNGQPLDPEETAIRMERQRMIYNTFDSYAELSPSGKGLHIIVKGSIKSGRKRSSVEVYSNQRYMTMTGNIYGIEKPIVDYHAFINSLWEEMGKGKEATAYYAGLEHATQSDEMIVDIASRAANAEKFYDLYNAGNWQKYYPSQSEADISLINIIAYYTQNRAQIKRIFLNSALGQRPKSRANYRIGYALNKAFDRMLPPIDTESLRNQLNEILEKKKAEKATPAIALADNYMGLPAPAELVPTETDVYSCPPGLLGEIAQYIYAQSPLPVKEISIAGAIGLLAGIVGKAYNISGTGCNQYVILLSLTGTGKEAMASGIAKLMTEVKKTIPKAGDFIGPGAISSEQALIKYMYNTSSSFVSIFGEFAITLQQLSSDKAPPHQIGVRRMLLDLYNKSGAGNEVQPTIYSDKEKNTNIVQSPAFSMLAESSPEIFYSVLNEEMVTGGLLPRMLVIENLGELTKPNDGAKLVVPSKELLQKMATICGNSLNLIHQKKVLEVDSDDEAKKILSDFREYARNNIIGSKEIRRQLWNRAHIKALKLAALVAIGVAPFNPLIDREAALWAINIVMNDIRNLSKRFDAGEVGIDNEETRQLSRAVDVVKDFVTRPHSELVTYGVSQLMHSERIIPYGYLQKRLSQTAPYRKDKMGATNALKRNINTLKERGDLVEVPIAKRAQYSTTANCYMIANLKAFGL